MKNRSGEGAKRKRLPIFLWIAGVVGIGVCLGGIGVFARWKSGNEGRPRTEADAGAPSRSVRASETPTKPTGTEPETLPSPTPAPAASDAPADPAAAAPVVPVAEDDAFTTEPTLILSGHVRFEDGSPAPEATVTLRSLDMTWQGVISHPLVRTRTDETGFYRLTARDSTEFLAQATREGAGTRTEFIVDSEAIRERRHPTGTRRVTLDFALAPEVVLAGRVVTPDDEPANGVAVRALLPSDVPSALPFARRTFVPVGESVADAEGRFRFENLAAGTVLLTVEAAEFNPLEETVEAPRDDIVLRLDAARATVGGFVILVPSGEGLPGATVTLRRRPLHPRINPHPIRKTLETDAAGSFRFENMPVGSYRIEVEKTPLMTFLSPDSSPDMFELTATEREPVLRYFLFEGHAVGGRVTNRLTGAPIEGASVTDSHRRHDPAYSTLSGPDGTYRLAGFPPGAPVSLVSQKKGYTAARDSFTIATEVQLGSEAIETRADLEMLPTVTISGRVQTDTGEAVGQAAVTASITQEPRGFTKGPIPVGADGAFEFEVPPFLIVRISAKSSLYPNAKSDMLEVQDEDIADVVIVFEKEGVEVGGRVEDPEGNPVVDAEVEVREIVRMGNITLARTLQKTTTTPPDGRFRFTGLPRGEVAFFAKKEGYLESEETEVALRREASGSDLRLRLRSSHFIAGRVADSRGNPVAGASMALVRHQPSSRYSYGTDVRTDAEGRYRLEGLQRAIYTVEASQPGASASVDGVEVDRDDVDLVFEDEDPASSVPCVLIGLVVDEATGHPVPDFQVVVSGHSGLAVKKDPAIPGQFTLEGVPCGELLAMNIRAPGYTDWNERHIAIPYEAGTFRETFALGVGGAVIGRVLDAEDGAPVAGVRVVMRTAVDERQVRRHPPTATTQTEDDGLFVFERIAAGDTLVEFFPAAPLQPITRRVRVEHEKTTDLGDVVLKEGGVVHGRLLRMPGAVPVAGREIRLSGSVSPAGQRIATTDAEGVFRFDHLRQGRGRLNAAGASNLWNVELAAGEEREVVLRIGTASFVGRIFRRGEPVQTEARLRRADEEHGPLFIQTDERGAFRIEELEGGAYRLNIQWLEFHRSGTDPARRRSRDFEYPVALIDGETIERDFHLPGGAIAGRVVDADGDPAPGVLLRLRLTEPSPSAPDRYSHSPVTSDANGEFVFMSLPGGTYHIEPLNVSYGGTTGRGLALDDDAERAGVELRLE